MRTSFRLAIAIATLSALASPLAARDATPETKALAVQVVATDGDTEKLVAGLKPVEAMLAQTIAASVGANDSTSRAQITGIVRDAFSLLPGRIVDAEVEAYAADFSPGELRGILAFLTGPGGRAEAANLPLMKLELGVAIRMDDAEAAKAIQEAEAEFAKAPPARRALILRIFAAQKTEMHVRRDYAGLIGMFGRVLDAAGTAAPADADPQKAARQAHDLDALVQRVMAIERRFYTLHYTDAELETVAAYLESEAGQALLDRMPLIKHAADQAMQSQLSRFLSTIEQPVCSAIACSSDQRTRLKTGAHQLSEMLSAMVRAGT